MEILQVLTCVITGMLVGCFIGSRWGHSDERSLWKDLFTEINLYKLRMYNDAGYTDTKLDTKFHDHLNSICFIRLNNQAEFVVSKGWIMDSIVLKKL